MNFYKCLIIIVFILCLITPFSCKDTEYAQENGFDSITIRLQWKIQSQFAGYFVALDKGFYEEYGLLVNIEEGGYGQNNLVTVKHGLEQFGTKWVADLIGDGGDFISIANIVKSNGLILLAKNDKNIKNIKDFKNKTISIWFIGNEYQLYALLKSQGVDRNDLDIVNQKWDMSQFFNDEVDIASAMLYNEYLQVLGAGYKSDDLTVFDYADFNIDFPGHSIFTSREYFLNNKDICRRFVQASLKGWEYAVRNPEEAVSIVLKYNERQDLDFNTQLEQMKIMIELIAPDRYTIGIHNREDIEKIADIYYEYNVISQYPDIDAFFTDEFVQQ